MAGPDSGGPGASGVTGWGTFDRVSRHRRCDHADVMRAGGNVWQSEGGRGNAPNDASP